MSDSSDLEEMSELIEALENLAYGDCNGCPLFFSSKEIVDECGQIQDNIPNGNKFFAMCKEVRAKKIDEVVRYIFERSLRDEG